MKGKIKSISRRIAFLGKSLWNGLWKHATTGASLAIIALATYKLVVASSNNELYGFGESVFVLVWNCFFIGLGMSGLKDYVKESQK